MRSLGNKGTRRGRAFKVNNVTAEHTTRRRWREKPTKKKTKLLKKKHPLVAEPGKSKLGNKAEASSETSLTRTHHLLHKQTLRPPTYPSCPFSFFGATCDDLAEHLRPARASTRSPWSGSDHPTIIALLLRELRGAISPARRSLGNGLVVGSFPFHLGPFSSRLLPCLLL